MIEDVLPENIGVLTAKNVIDLNINRKEERVLFRNRINDLVYRLPKIGCEL